MSFPPSTMGTFSFPVESLHFKLARPKTLPDAHRDGNMITRLNFELTRPERIKTSKKWKANSSMNLWPKKPKHQGSESRKDDIGHFPIDIAQTLSSDQDK